MNKRGADFIKCVGCVLAITTVAGLLLGFVYNLTKEPIAKADAKAFEESCRTIFTENQISFTRGDLAEAIAGKIEGEFAGNTIDAVINVDKSGTVIGKIVAVTTSEGYGGDISILVGIDNDGRIKGVSITSINETPGLGMNAEDLLIGQFEGKKESNFTVTKNGKIKDSEIDVMTGATVTSNAVTEAVNAAVAYNNALAGE